MKLCLAENLPLDLECEEDMIVTDIEEAGGWVGEDKSKRPAELYAEQLPVERLAVSIVIP